MADKPDGYLEGAPFCPRCGAGTEQTCMGMINAERDTNRALCVRCGWRGEAWQCVNRPMALVKCADGGILREFYKDREWGQLSMRTIPPGQAKPGHIHQRRDEMWVLARGRVRVTVGGGELASNSFPLKPWYALHMPAGVGHAVENLGTDEAVILFWSSEVYDPEDPDVENWEPT